MRVFLNLCAGLDSLGVAYRVNNYGYSRRNPAEPVGIVGKSHVLDKNPWRNPILFGASVFSHPVDDPNLLRRLPVELILVPGEWYRRMFEPYYGEKVKAWPVGIDTDKWTPKQKEVSHDFLIYDKVRWDHNRYEKELKEPIRSELRRRGLSFDEIRYGFYREEEFRKKLEKCRAMIFLCEHESQGIAYQQALSCGVPILAWDRGGEWQDPSYYPHKVKFGPVTSVPYWDPQCGIKFKIIEEFSTHLEEFLEMQKKEYFNPRDYILKNLTLKKSAECYLSHLSSLSKK
jgi:hypothetical protein